MVVFFGKDRVTQIQILDSDFSFVYSTNTLSKNMNPTIYLPVSPPPNECPGYDTKQSDGEVPVMLRPSGIWSTPSFPLLPGPLKHGVEAPDMALSKV